MPKTAVGLFKNPDLVADVVRAIAALGFPRNEVRTLEEPETFEVTGVMSFARLDFEAHLSRALTKIGATEAQTQAYVEGLRRGGALVFATGSDEKVDAAADILNRHGAIGIEETSTSSPEPELPYLTRGRATPVRDTPDLAGQAGRIPPSGVAYFAW
jgi:hypothetical protein